MTEGSVRVAIIMGSESDLPVMQGAATALDELGVAYEMRVVSAHRTPVEMAEFAAGAAAAGHRGDHRRRRRRGASPGMVAAHSCLPVIGVPVAVGHLQGMDALLSIAQMPKGVPVATVAIGGAYNAGVLAAQMLAFGGSQRDAELASRLATFKEGLRQKALAMKV